MNCYENLLNNHSKCNNKNKSTDFSNNFMKNEDNFFTFIFKNIHIYKNNQEDTNNIENTNTNDNTNVNTNDNTNNNTNINTNENVNNNLNTNNIDFQIENNEIIKSYIKKCYKRIVLKCHPDKNNNLEDNKYFIKCQEYYDNSFLIGLLYIFYLYKLVPPLLCDVIINRILCEIRIIQEKILLFQN